MQKQVEKSKLKKTQTFKKGEIVCAFPNGGIEWPAIVQEYLEKPSLYVVYFLMESKVGILPQSKLSTYTVGFEKFKQKKQQPKQLSIIYQKINNFFNKQEKDQHKKCSNKDIDNLQKIQIAIPLLSFDYQQNKQQKNQLSHIQPFQLKKQKEQDQILLDYQQLENLNKSLSLQNPKLIQNDLIDDQLSTKKQKKKKLKKIAKVVEKCQIKKKKKKERANLKSRNANQGIIEVKKVVRTLFKHLLIKQIKKQQCQRISIQLQSKMTQKTDSLTLFKLLQWIKKNDKQVILKQYMNWQINEENPEKVSEVGN